MNQITTRYITENGACYEQYVITDPEAKTALTITPERGGMITSFTLDGEEFVWTRRPNFSECNRPRFGVPVLFPSCGNPDNGVHIFDGKAYPMETHGFADLCAWEVDSVGPDGVTLALESTPLTKFLYPFDFTLLLNYNLEGNKALVSLTVINEGNTDMPFSFGYHPYFTASKLENVEFDIKCATCSDNAKGEQPAAPEKITLTRKEGADNSVRLLTGVHRALMAVALVGEGHGERPQGDRGCGRDLWQRRAVAAGCRELRLHGALERLGQQRERGRQARGAGAGRGHDQPVEHHHREGVKLHRLLRAIKSKCPAARNAAGHCFYAENYT